jgi:glucose-1-phosphate cytidylyltransferase
MKIYAHFGYNDFILCLGYKGEMIKRFFLDYELKTSDIIIHLSDKSKTEVRGLPHERDWKITLAETGLNSMTGARIKRIERYIDSDLFMLTYGDAVANLNIEHLVEFHRAHDKVGTITAVHPLSRFGELQIGKNNIVKAFKEKAVIKGDYINGGFFVFDRRIFNYLDNNDYCILEGEPLERLTKDGQLVAYFHDGYWQCMDTYRDWQILDQEWEKDNPQWKVW